MTTFRWNHQMIFMAIMLMSCIAGAQTMNIYEMPRLSVTGEATTKVDADIIYAYLNIYDNNYSFDYSMPYDDKALKKKQSDIIEKLGLKNAMIYPTAGSLMSGTANSPFLLKFNSKTEFEAAQVKCMKESSDSYSVSLDFNKAEVSDEKKKNIYGQLLEKAMGDAKAKAEKMSKGFGAILGRVLMIEEIRDYVYTPEANYEYDTTYLGAVDMMVSITAKVLVQYELK